MYLVGVFLAPSFLKTTIMCRHRCPLNSNVLQVHETFDVIVSNVVVAIFRLLNSPVTYSFTWSITFKILQYNKYTSFFHRTFSLWEALSWKANLTPAQVLLTFVWDLNVKHWSGCTRSWLCSLINLVRSHRLLSTFKKDYRG